MMSEEHAAAQASRRSFLNSAQQTVIQEVLTSPDRIHGLQGLAGTGKTTVLSSIREGAEQGGYAVEGFAPTSRAAAQLREAGINATTLQSFLARGSQGQVDGDGAVHFSSRHGPVAFETKETPSLDQAVDLRLKTFSSTCPFQRLLY